MKTIRTILFQDQQIHTGLVEKNGMNFVANSMFYSFGFYNMAKHDVLFFIIFILFFYFYYFIIIIFLFVVDFVIHWNETAMGLHVFPIPIPPPTSLSIRSL